MRRLLPLLMSAAVWGLMLCMPSVAAASSVLYNNFGAGSSYNNSAGNAAGNGLDGSGNDYAEGDLFSVYSTAQFTNMQIALSCASSCKDPFTVVLRSDSGNEPGTAIETFTVAGKSLGALGSDNTPLDLVSVRRPILNAGKDYWITVQADSNDAIVWNLNSTGDGSSEAISTDNAVTWFAPSGLTAGAFAIDGNIPEPSTRSLLVAAFGMLGCSVLRKIRTTNK